MNVIVDEVLLWEWDTPCTKKSNIPTYMVHFIAYIHSVQFSSSHMQPWQGYTFADLYTHYWMKNICTVFKSFSLQYLRYLYIKCFFATGMPLYLCSCLFFVCSLSVYFNSMYLSLVDDEHWCSYEKFLFTFVLLKCFLVRNNIVPWLFCPIWILIAHNLRAFLVFFSEMKISSGKDMINPLSMISCCIGRTMN